MHSHIKFFGGMVRGLLASLICHTDSVPSTIHCYSLFLGGRGGGYSSLHDGRQKMKGSWWLESWPDKLLICLKRSLKANHARRFDPNWAVNYSGFCQLSMKIIILISETLKNYDLQATPPFRQWYRVIFYWPSPSPHFYYPIGKGPAINRSCSI